MAFFLRCVGCFKKLFFALVAAGELNTTDSECAAAPASMRKGNWLCYVPYNSIQAGGCVSIVFFRVSR
jgi:hypothetical protein